MSQVKKFILGFEFGYAQEEVNAEVLRTAEEGMSEVLLPPGFDAECANLPGAQLQGDGSLKMTVCDDFLF